MAGLEERLNKLESILHRLFCCDSNQFVGPAGPQGPQGTPGTPGLQGPPGVQGAVGPAGLNWQGAWTPCVVYSQDDAVGYNGASYYVICPTSDSAPCYAYIVTGTGTFDLTTCDGADYTVIGMPLPQVICSLFPIAPTIGGLTFTPTTGDDCPSTACAPPNVNPCFALLASQGAVGSSGPTGLTGVSGNDGSNSGRWKFLTTTNIVGAPGSTYFVADTVNFNTLSKIVVSNGDINSTSYQDWWIFLEGIYTNYQPLVLVQITEVGSNNIIGIWEVDSKLLSPIILNPTYVEIYLDPVYVGSGVLTPNKNYTISWSIHGGVNGGNAPKTEGVIFPVVQPGPYPTFQYDFNNYKEQPVVGATTYFAALPAPTFIGQTLVVRALGTILDYNKAAGIISHDGSSIIFVNFTTVDYFSIMPQSVMRFTWSGTYWVTEDIQGGSLSFNRFMLADSYYDIMETLIDPSLVYPTKVSLNLTYISSIYPQGVKVYFPYIPGGPRVFTKISNISNDWASYPYITVT